MAARVCLWIGRSKEQNRSTEYTLLSLIHALSTDGTDKHPGMQTCDLLPPPLLFAISGTEISVCFIPFCPVPMPH
jgi:hypothetical protein